MKTGVRQEENGTVAGVIGGRVDETEAATYMQVSKSLLSKQRFTGTGPRYLKLGGRIFYRIRDLDEYLNSCIVETADSRRQRVA